MFTRVYYFIFGYLMLNPLAAAATGETFSAKQLLEIAIAKNPELRALRLEVEAGHELYGQAGRWANPTLDLGASQKEEEGVTNFARVGLSQQLPRPNRLKAQVKLAEASRAAQNFARDGGEIALRAEVIRRIYAHKAADQKASHARERLKRFQTVGTYLRSQVFASPQKKAEATIVRAKIMLLGRQFRELEANHQSAWNELNLYLGLNTEPEINVSWFRKSPSYTLNELVEQAAQKNPQLAKQTAELKMAEANVLLEETEAFPGVVLSGEYNHGEGAQPEKSYGLGLSFPLPVWNPNVGGVNAYKARSKASAERRNWALEGLKQDLSSALAKYEAARVSVIELKPEEADRLEKDMDATDRAFKKGQVDLLTYIEADAEHFAALNAIYEVQADFAAASTELLALAGQAPSLE